MAKLLLPYNKRTTRDQPSMRHESFRLGHTTTLYIVTLRLTLTAYHRNYTLLVFKFRCDP